MPSGRPTDRSVGPPIGLNSWFRCSGDGCFLCFLGVLGYFSMSFSWVFRGCLVDFKKWGFTKRSLRSFYGTSFCHFMSCL